MEQQIIFYLLGALLVLVQFVVGYIINDVKKDNKSATSRIVDLENRVNNNETLLAVNSANDDSRIGQLTDIKRSIDDFSKQLTEINKVLMTLTEQVKHLEELKLKR